MNSLKRTSYPILHDRRPRLLVAQQGDLPLEEEAFGPQALEALEKAFLIRVGDIGKDPNLLENLHIAYQQRFDLDAGEPETWSNPNYATEDDSVSNFYGIENRVSKREKQIEGNEEVINRLILDAIDDVANQADSTARQNEIFETEHWRRRGNFDDMYYVKDFDKEILRDGVDADGWHPFYNPISTSDKKNVIDLVATLGMDDTFPRQHPAWLVDKKEGPFSVKLSNEAERPLAQFFMNQSGAVDE